MSLDEIKQLHVLISGRVQGVGFRYFVQRAAQQNAVRGWVRNLFDGRVEALAEGPQADLDHLLRRMKQGPPTSEVENIAEGWAAAQGEWEDFQIRATGSHSR